MVHTHRDFLQDGVADARFDLLDLLKCRGFVKTPDEKIDVTGRSEMLMIKFSTSTDERSAPGGKHKSMYRWAFLDVSYLFGTGRRAVTTELPAATTLDQSRSAREDSENRLKFFLKSWMDSTVAGTPAGFRLLAVNGIIWCW